MTRTLLLCDCMGSQEVDADRISAASGLTCSRVHTALCTDELAQVAKALQGGEAIVACGQEQAVFADLAAELGVPAPGFVDLRDRAGWTEAGADVAPKMAALAAEAVLPAALPGSVDVVSEGLCLVAGPAETALEFAETVGEALAVTVLITDGGDLPPLVGREGEVIRGRLVRVSGALGGFSVTIDALEQRVPGGRGAWQTGAPRDGGASQCDVLVDLTGGTPLVSAPDKREGYLRADPTDRQAVMRAAVEAVQLTGTFEKPLYVRLAPELCAHSRATKTGCTRCLDICPTGAILPDGDHVSVDPMVCAGCGACAALCPSAAITYDDPPFDNLLARMEVLARVFRSAGGSAPRLLVHDARGADLIRAAARYGRGLPADVIPLELRTASGFGHAEMLAALAHGFAAVHVLTGPATETDALKRERDLTEAIAGPGRVELLSHTDPDAMSDALYSVQMPAPLADPILPMGGRRQVTRLAAQALNPAAGAPLDLPEGAPYGAVLVDTDACTLCLACVSLCPSGALLDNPDAPQLRFQEAACLQCGLCANVCPESAIAYEPRLNLAPAALSDVVLNEEEPFACIECGALFGVASTIEKIMEMLAGKHPMFATTAQGRMIQMCDDCRVKVQFGMEDNPMAGDDKPRVRTSEDYFSDRKDH